MRLGGALYVLGGILAIGAMSVYAIFRIGNIAPTIFLAGTGVEITVIILFFFAELYIIVNSIFYFINVLISRFVYRRGEVKPLEKEPRVIVLLPMRNEPLDVIEKAFRAIRFLDYKNFEVVIVDSSDDQTHRNNVELLGNKYGFTYFMTPLPLHGAKAGALNEAMMVHVAPYYAIFDADYRPIRSFLKRLMPQIVADKKIAYIQTPQFYGNHSRFPISRVAQIQQSIFYEYICEAKSVHNAVFMCGTNLVVRRAALVDVGFFEEESVTEDYATSMRISLAGWDVKYDNYTTAFGDGPVNLEQYFKQQYRWARGTFEAFFTHMTAIYSPNAPLSWWQRIEYSLSGIWFFVGVVWMIMLTVPLLFIVFDIQAFHSDPYMFTFIYLPYFCLSALFYFTTLRTRRYSIRDLILAQSLVLLTLPIYFRAFLNLLFSRRTATFEVVEKRADPYAMPWRHMKLQLSFITFNAFAVAYGAYILPTSPRGTSILVNMLWGLLHLFIMLYLIAYIYGGKLSFRRRSAGGAVY